MNTSMLNVRDFNGLHPIAPAASDCRQEPLEIHTLDSTSRWLCNRQAVSQNHGQFEIVWITKGKCRLIVDLNHYELDENHIFYLNPGESHQIIADQSIQGYSISFRREFLFASVDTYNGKFLLSDSFLGKRQSCLIKLNAGIQTELFEIIRNMQTELRNASILKADILQGFLKIFLIYLTRQKNLKLFTPKLPSSEVTRKFLLLVEHKFVTNHRVSDYADLIAVTPSYLNEIVKRDSGFPASYHIFQRIVLEAKRMSLLENRSLKQVAFSLGFDDAAHFSKFFKNVSGVNFTDFKKMSGI